MQSIRRTLKQHATLRDGGDLRTGMGGHVPGTGTGDKIPAKYEPGEFVVSNDMLDTVPGLRQQLRGLRGHVLANKGITPEEADAAAVSGGETLDAIKDAAHTSAAVQRGLRNGGSDGQGQNDEIGMGGRQAGASGGVQERSGVVGASSSAGMGDQSSVRGGAGVHPLEQIKGQTLRLNNGGGIPGLDVLERPFTSADSRAFATAPGPGNPNIGPNGSSQAQSFRAPPAASPTPSIPATPRPTLRAGVAAQPTALSKSTFVAGRAVNGVAKLANSPLGRAAGGAGVVANFNDYKINDPDVDSSAGGTLRALGNGDFTGAGRSLSKGALETGMDLGSFAANTADFFVPGKAPVSTAYNKMLRTRFGDQLGADPGVTAQAKAASAAGNGRGFINPPNITPGGDAMPDQDVAPRPTLRGQSGTDMGNGVSKFVQNGKTLYSNVAGPDNDKLMSGRPGVSVIPGMSRDVIDRTLGGLSASQVSADNAIRTANLRDGVDMERGTSAEVAGRQAKEDSRLAYSPFGTPGRGFARQRLRDMAADETARRGQDMSYGSAIAGQQSTARTAAAAARTDQMNKDRAYQFDVAKFGEDQAKNGFDQRQKAEKDLREEIGSMLPPGADGKPDMEAASRYAVGLNASMAAFQESLSKKAAAGDAKAAATLADVRKRGPAALDASDKRAFVNSMKVKDLAERYSSGRFNPIGGSAVATDEPRTGLRKTGDGFMGFGGEYVTDQGDVIPARAIEREDGDIFGGRRRVDLRTR